ncbi:MAG TPA: hypothetical protein VG102_02415, partial [Candidatus Paceibacterota bacterium]|nr:hypothetical protein [Candidatus Paceibacterota bacterium]
ADRIAADWVGTLTLINALKEFKRIRQLRLSKKFKRVDSKDFDRRIRELRKLLPPAEKIRPARKGRHLF